MRNVPDMTTLNIGKSVLPSVIAALCLVVACKTVNAAPVEAQAATQAGAAQSEATADLFLEPLRELGTGPEWGMSCPTYSGAEHLVERAKDTVILLGELPGTDQSPEAVISLVCDLLAKGIPVNLGFAIPDPYLQRLQDPDRRVLMLRDRIYDAAPILWEGAYPKFGTRGNRKLLETVIRLQYDGHDIEMFGMVPEISGYGEVVRYSQTLPLIDRELKMWSERSEGEAIVFLTDAVHAGWIWRDLTRSPQHNRPVETHVQLSRQTLFYRMVPSGGEALVWQQGNTPRSGSYSVGEVPEVQPYFAGEATEKHFAAVIPPVCGPTQKCQLPSSDGYYFTGEATLSAPGFPFDRELEMSE